jgi:hypothetical protein
VALLLLLPLVLLGPALLPGQRFLPLSPAGEPPLSLDDAEAAARARVAQNHLMLDRLYPTLTDQRAIREQVLSGHLPLWEPDLALGTPLLGNTMAAPLYPPHVLALILPPDRAAGPLGVLRLVLAGFGVWLLLGRLGLSPGARLAGAIAMQAGGYGLENLHDSMKVDTALWLPWALWAVEGIRARAPRAPLALALSVAMALLAGFPPIAVFTCATAALWALVRLAPRGGRALGAAVVALALGGLVASAQLLPTLETARHSTREARGGADLADEAIPGCTGIGLVVPRLFGSPTETPPPFGPVTAWWLAPPERWEHTQNANALEWSAFAGVFAVLLALAGLAGDPRRAGPPAALLLLVFAYAYGWPGARWLYHLPGLDVGAPNRALAIAWPLWAWLAGVGAGAIGAGHGRARIAMVTGAALLAFGTLAWRATIDPVSFPEDLRAVLTERYAELGPAAEAVEDVAPVELAERAGLRIRGGLLHAGLFALALGVVAALAGRRRGPIAAWAPLCLLIAAEGVAAGRPHLAPRSVGPAGLFPPSELVEAVRQAAGDGRVMRYDPDALDDTLRLAKPNLLHGYGIADATPYKALSLASSVALFEAMDPRTRYRSGVARIPDLALLDSPTLDWARVTCVLSAEAIEHPRLKPFVAREGFHVYRRLGTLPPARVARFEVGYPDPFQEIASGGLVPQLEVDLQRDSSWTNFGQRPDPDRVDLHARNAPDHLDATVIDTGGGFLVFHEAWMPGWRATVNGERAEVLRADGAFRAVEIPAGERVEVRTWYAPWSFRGGALLSLAALVALAIWTARGKMT